MKNTDCLRAWDEACHLITNLQLVKPREREPNLTARLNETAIAMVERIALAHEASTSESRQQYLSDALELNVALRVQFDIAWRFGTIEATRARQLIEETSSIARHLKSIIPGSIKSTHRIA